MLEAPGGKDRYSIRERIGIGSMGTVFRATDHVTGDDVALKVLHEHYSDDPTFIARFRDEARCGARIQHQNVARVLDYGRWDERYYIAMELVEGTTLRDCLAGGRRLAIDEAVQLILQVSAAIEAAHALGIVHRDLKPENILIDQDGVVKVCDFGLARMVAAAAVRTTGAALGTAQYLSPEEAQGKLPGPEADVYALGIILYEMLSGEPPFSAYSAIAVALRHLNDKPRRLRELNAEVPEGLDAVTQKALAKRPEQRYRDAGEFRKALLPLTGAPQPSVLQAIAQADRRERPQVSRGGSLIPLRAWAPLGVLAAALLGLGLLLNPGGSAIATPADAASEGLDAPPEAPVEEAAAEPAVEEAPPVEAVVEEEPPPPAAPGVAQPAPAPRPAVAAPAPQPVTPQIIIVTTSAPVYSQPVVAPAVPKPSSNNGSSGSAGKGRGKSEGRDKDDD